MTDISAINEAEVIEAVRAARSSRRTMEIVGAGTKRAYGRSAKCDDILDVSNLRGIVNYEPEELILTVLPGAPVAEITQLLAAKNQRLGFDPADLGPLLGAKANAATIGGVLSADASGSAAVRYGRARDSLLGFRAVNGLAEGYKAGGRVVKNVTGFDLPKLMCGAMGTLGVLTEVTLRVFPKPAYSQTYLIRNVTRFAGSKLLRRVWQSPLESTGLSYVPMISAQAFEELGDIGAGAALFRLEGSRFALREKGAMLGDFLQSESLEEVENGDAIFRKISSGGIFGDTMFDINIKYQQPWVSSDYEESPRERASHMWIADWAGALVWRAGTPGLSIDSNIPYYTDSVLVRASQETRERARVFPVEPPARAALTKSVKAAFDPLRLFNPGRMWDGV